MQNFFNTSDAQTLLERLSKLTATTPARWGKMNAGQMLVHLRDGIDLALGKRPSTPQGPAFLRTAFGRWLLLGPVRWPPGQPAPQEMDGDRQGSSTSSFTADMALLQERLRLIEQATALQAHPFFGQMSRTEWGRLTWKHLDHHLRQFGL
jgi:hypothetical protein